LLKQLLDSKFIHTYCEHSLKHQKNNGYFDSIITWEKLHRGWLPVKTITVTTSRKTISTGGKGSQTKTWEANKLRTITITKWATVDVGRSAFQADYELWAGEEGEVRAAGGEHRNGARASCFRN